MENGKPTKTPQPYWPNKFTPISVNNGAIRRFRPTAMAAAPAELLGMNLLIREVCSSRGAKWSRSDGTMHSTRKKSRFSNGMKNIADSPAGHPASFSLLNDPAARNIFFTPVFLALPFFAPGILLSFSPLENVGWAARLLAIFFIPFLKLAFFFFLL